MKIKQIRIENFRTFQDETIELGSYVCFVGPNGAGKSTVLAALNVFFQERGASATDVSKLSDEDYFRRDVSKPVRITLTFDHIGREEAEELDAYVRQNELVVTAEAEFNEQARIGVVRHYGQRLGMPEFKAFFEAEKDGAKAAVLSEIYDGLRQRHPDLPSVRSKDEKAQALRDYELQHPDQCVLIPSADDFYGINSTGKLARFVQWIYVPAVKDAGEEATEGRNTAFGRLVARVVRSRTNFDAELEQLRNEALVRYQELLDRNQASLADLSQALQGRLESWAHPNARLDIEWMSDPAKSVSVQAPVAGVRTGDGDFVGSLSRVGHGLQRSYLLALLQELAGADVDNAPLLILGCEEPELYQHPPQARHLAEVLEGLASRNSQVLITTHSPIFVSGDGFENVRVVRQNSEAPNPRVRSVSFPRLCARIREALGEDWRLPEAGLITKIHQVLQPGIAEMFFARVPILVEGQEDVSYIATELHLSGRWSEFRRLGCHLIPVHGKDRLIKPLAIAAELQLPVFVMFDSDGDTHERWRPMHERDNRALNKLLGLDTQPFPDQCLIGQNYAIWANCLGERVRADFGEIYDRVVDAARLRHGNERGLDKQDLFIADWLSAGRAEGCVSNTLTQLCDAILEFSRAA